MEILFGILAFIIVLMIIISIHEFGHFFWARKANILCFEFSLGMGPLIWRKKGKETYFSIRAIPIGGFVSPAGEDGDQDFIEDGKNVRLLLDDRGRVAKIIHNIDFEEYKNLPLYTVVSHDLFGTMEASEDELFVVVQNIETEEEIRYIVNRDCLVEFKKKEEYQIAPKNRSMSSKSVGARFLTIFGGPVMNFILAIIIYFVIGIAQGYPLENKTFVSSIDQSAPAYDVLHEGDELKKINDVSLNKWSDISKALNDIASGKNTSFEGVVKIEYITKDGNTQSAIIAPAISIYSIELMLDTNATKDNKIVVGEYSTSNEQTKSYKAGLRKGDVITGIKINDEKKELSSLNDLLSTFVNIEKSSLLTIYYERENTEYTTQIECYSKDLLDSQGVSQTKVQLGISPQYGYNLGKLLYMPFLNTAESCLGIFKTLGLLFTDSSVHIDDFSGPVGIFQLISSTVMNGIIPLLSLMAFLSVNIGFVNLLPLPALDGGRLVFIIYEAITKKKPSAKVENIVHSIGFILLMALFVFISFNDILRLFGCK